MEYISVSIKECVLCGKSHENVELHAYEAVMRHYSHFYECPSFPSRQPVPLYLAKGDSILDDEVIDKLMSVSDRAHLTYVSWLDGSGVVQWFLKRSGFPKNRYDEVIRNLRVELEKELGHQPIVNIPLPVAPEFADAAQEDQV